MWDRQLGTLCFPASTLTIVAYNRDCRRAIASYELKGIHTCIRNATVIITVFAGVGGKELGFLCVKVYSHTGESIRHFENKQQKQATVRLQYFILYLHRSAQSKFF